MSAPAAFRYSATVSAIADSPSAGIRPGGRASVHILVDRRATWQGPQGAIGERSVSPVRHSTHTPLAGRARLTERHRATCTEPLAPELHRATCPREREGPGTLEVPLT